MGEQTSFETIRVESDGNLGFLTLARPERLNAVDGTMLSELARAAVWFDDRSEVDVVVLRGEGRAFCAGADLKAMGAASELNWRQRREAGQLGRRAMNALEQMRALTVAQVQGYAVGGGFLLMAACDLRVVAEDAVFFIPEVELGLPLAWGGVPRMVREIGPALTKELIITCRRFGPSEVAPMVNRIVPAERLVETTLELARTLAAMPAVPAAITKDHVNAVSRAIAGATDFADGDTLQWVRGDSESEAARLRYTERTLGGKRN